MDQKPDVDANELVEKREWVLYGCISIFTACLVISSITASKLWSLTLPVVDYEVIIPVGTSLFTLTFLATDVVGEVWGKRHSMMIVYLLLIMIISNSFYSVKTGSLMWFLTGTVAGVTIPRAKGLSSRILSNRNLD